MTDSPRYMSLATLAMALDVSGSTIKKWVAKGGFPQPQLVGPHLRPRWDWDEVREYMKYNRPKPKEGGIASGTKEARAERRNGGGYRSIFG